MESAQRLSLTVLVRCLVCAARPPSLLGEAGGDTGQKGTWPHQDEGLDPCSCSSAPEWETSGLSGAVLSCTALLNPTPPHVLCPGLGLCQGG